MIIKAIADTKLVDLELYAINLTGSLGSKLAKFLNEDDCMIYSVARTLIYFSRNIMERFIYESYLNPIR